MVSAGVTTYRGFLYQQEYFYKFLIENIFNGDFLIGFEINDDVNIEYNLASIKYSETLIQVKSGDLGLDDVYKIFDNWLIETDFSNYSKYSYKLISEKTFSIVLNEEFLKSYKDHILDSATKDVRSIRRKAYDKIKLIEEAEREKIINHIFTHYNIDGNKSLQSIIEDQERLFYEKFCTDIDNDLTIPKKERLKFNKNAIFENITESIKNRKAYSINNNEFFSLLTRGSQKYGNEIFDPDDFTEFKEDNYTIEQLNMILNENRLEVKQLKLAERTSTQIYEDILKELFYRRLITYYNEVDKSKVLSTHEEARSNYLDAFDRLTLKNAELSPKNLYIETTLTDIKSKIIADTGGSRFLQKGCYIHMTSSDIDEKLRIKWGDIKDE